MFTTPGSRVGRKTANRLNRGYFANSRSLGIIASGSLILDPAVQGNYFEYTAGGAHTLVPPTVPCTMIIEVANASAGALTTTAFSVVDGDTYSSTGTKKHVFYVTRTKSYSHLNVRYVTGT